MRYSTNPTIIDECLQIKVADLKRSGCFVPNKVVRGVMQWNNGKQSIGITVDNNTNIVTVKYTANGDTHKHYHIIIVERAANIGSGVVRFFECPISGHLCRKLYLYGDMFVSRRVMRGAMYRSQVNSKLDRMMPSGWGTDDFIPYKRYGKMYYRGRLTPYGKRIKRYEGIVDRATERFMIEIVNMIRR